MGVTFKLIFRLICMRTFMRTFVGTFPESTRGNDPYIHHSGARAPVYDPPVASHCTFEQKDRQRRDVEELPFHRLLGIFFLIQLDAPRNECQNAFDVCQGGEETGETVCLDCAMRREHTW